MVLSICWGRATETRLALLILSCAAFAGLAHSQAASLTLLGQVGGAQGSLAFEGSFVFVGAGGRFSVFEVPNPGSIVPRGSIVLPGWVHGVHAQGGYAYVSWSNNILGIVDVRDPDNLRFVGGVTATPNQVVVSQGLAYLAESSGLKIVDVSNPEEPSVVSNLLLAGDTIDLALANDRVYTASFAGGMHIVDVTNPSTPVLLGTFNDYETHDVAAAGTLAYLAAGPDGLRIVDVSNPASPVEVGFDDSTFAVLGIELIGSTAYLAASAQGLQIVDVSNPAAPVVVGQEAGLVPPILASDVAVSGQIACLTDNGGIRVVDISTPASPVETAKYDSFSFCQGLDVAGNYAYIASRESAGLRVIDVSDAEAPRHVAFYTRASGIELRAVDVDGTYAYCAYGQFGLVIVDVSDPLAPVEVSSVNTPGDATDIVVSGSYAYVADDTGGVRIVDVGAPLAPSEVASIPTADAAIALDELDGSLYVAASTAGLQIFDVTNPVAPTLLATFDTPVMARDVAVQKNVAMQKDIAYVADETGGLRMIDVTNPAAPTLLGFTTEEAYTVSVDGRQAYIFTGTEFNVIDVTVPTSPALTALYDFKGGGTQTRIVARNFAYVGSEVLGLNILAIPPPAPILGPFPRFIDTTSVTITGAVVRPGSFVAVGGGTRPAFQQLAELEDTFSIEIELNQESVNTISVTTMNEFGLVSLPAIARVVEGVAYPSVVTTVTTLAVTPSPAGAVALNDTLAFTCTATFNNSATADVTQFVQWEDIANGEVITPGGLYLNNKAGTAQVRAFVAGVFSNVVNLGDGP